MSDTIKLTASQGNQLLQDCFGLQVPDKLEGVGTFTHQTVATIQKNIRQLKKALVAVSPIYQKHKKLHFGPSRWYVREERAITGDKKEMEADALGEVVKHRFVRADGDPDETVEVGPLTGQAKAGLKMLLLLRCHPESVAQLRGGGTLKQTHSPGHQDEFVWPIAEQLGIVGDLERKIGVGAGTDVTWKTDEEYAAEEQAKKPALEKVVKDVAEALS